ncbi:hypothetical protein [Escherichia phage PJNS034]
MKVSIDYIIRSAILKHGERKWALLEIQHSLGVSRTRAKELFFAFTYHANEENLQRIARGEKVGKI